jgi:hypothetical protein
MYGFSGYATNSYGSERQSASVIVQIIRFGGRVFEGLYGAAVTFMRFGSTRTFQDPQSQSQIFQLPPQ